MESIKPKKRVGRGSEKYAYAFKGLSYQNYSIPDVRGIIAPLTLGVVVNPRGGHCDYYRFPYLYFVDLTSEREALEHAKAISGHIGVPGEAMNKIFGEETYNVSLFMKYVEGYNFVLFSLGLCDRMPLILIVMNHKKLAALFSSATGLEATWDDLFMAGERMFNLHRAFNVREGAYRVSDTVPIRCFQEPYATLYKVYQPIKREKLDALLDEYYRTHGWEVETGKPSKDALEKLGLEYIAEDFYSS